MNIIQVNSVKNRQSFGITGFNFTDKFSQRNFYKIPGIKEAELKLLKIKPESCLDVPIEVEAITEGNRKSGNLLHFWFNVRFDRGFHAKVDNTPRLAAADIEPSLADLIQRYSKYSRSRIGIRD